MNYPFKSLSFSTLSWLFFLLIVLTIIFYFIMQRKGKALIIDSVADKGIISLEFASNTKKTQQIITAWKKQKVLANAVSLQWLDFPFLIIYSTTLSLGCIWSTVLLSNFTLTWISTGIVLAWSQWVAALFDILENLALFPALKENKSWGFLPQIAAICAALKFSLVFTGILYIAVSVVIKLVTII